MSKRQIVMLCKIIIATVMLILLHFIGLSGMNRFLAYLTTYLIIGGDILLKAGKGIKNRQVFDENFLMAVATVGAFVLAFYKTGDYTEAVAVMLFYQIGELFQSYAVGKSRKNISALMDIRPDYANIEKDGKLQRISPEEVKIGSTIIVQPGEKIPLDGIVVKGESTLNTSALTGESLPRSVKTGDEIYSGCINISGVLSIQTTKEFSESTVSKILDLVENASSRKSKSENFISKFARIYTPAVCYAALLLALLPPLIRLYALHLPPDWENWIYRSLTFLVISCPCALVISIPLSFFAGIGGASKAGILIKGSNYLETLSNTKTVVFDKTGTLTQGVFDVCGVHHNTLDESQLIEYAALAESASTHPIGKSILRAYGQEVDRSRVSDIQEISGNGIIANVDGIKIALGNDKLMKSLNVKHINCHQVGTIIHAAVDREYGGHIVIADIIKPQAKQAIAALKKAGIKKTVMLTGDSNGVAQYVGNLLDIDEVYSELLPADKVSKIEELLKKQSTNDKLAFVGDGINDAPVLARADIGIAMGAIGSDAAIEAADVVLMDDDPMKITTAILLSRKCIGIVYQNIYCALLVKALCLLLGALGIANMWLAVFADVGVMIIAVLNAIRALFIPK